MKQKRRSNSYFIRLSQILVYRIVLNIRQAAHGDVSMSDTLSEPSFLTNTILGNIGGSFRDGEDELETVDEEYELGTHSRSNSSGGDA